MITWFVDIGLKDWWAFAKKCWFERIESTVIDGKTIYIILYYCRFLFCKYVKSQNDPYICMQAVQDVIYWSVISYYRCVYHNVIRDKQVVQKKLKRDVIYWSVISYYRCVYHIVIRDKQVVQKKLKRNALHHVIWITTWINSFRKTS